MSGYCQRDGATFGPRSRTISTGS